MDTLFIIMAISALLVTWLAAAWLDEKYQWRLIDWMNGTTSNPFKTKQQRFQRALSEKDAQIEALIERVQVLEKIVTEPAYELNQKINQL